MSSFSLRFTGLESDRFVALARKALDANQEVTVTVEGREPITSNPARFSGHPLEAIADGYRRVLRVKTSRGHVLDIGGTNTTKSIASDVLVYTDVRPPIVEHAADHSTLERWLDEAATATTDVRAFDALSYGLRSCKFDETERLAILAVAVQQLTCGSEDIRQRAIRVCGQIGGSHALPHMASAMRDPSVSVRREAALRLRSMESVIRAAENGTDAVACVDALALALLEDTDERVRIFAAEDLGYFYNPAAQEAVRKKLHGDDCEDVRWACAVAIGRSNEADAVPLLRSSLERETGASIRKAALLGIGRHAPDLVLRRPDVARVVIAELALIAENSASPGRDYAIHALGEFGQPAATYIEGLIPIVDSTDIQVAACAVMSVMKLLPFSSSHYALRDSVIERLGERVDVAVPLDWPEIGFYRSYLSSSGDLALALEDFHLAERYYSRASAAYEDIDWLCLFYTGAAAYTRAEARVASGLDLGPALTDLSKAVANFSAVESSPSFSDVDIGRSGLRLKQILAQARLATLSALHSWRPHAFETYEVEAIRSHLSRASDLYRRLDLTNLTDSERKLGPQEVALISCLQLLVGVLSELCHLAEAMLAHDGNRVTFATASVRAQARRLCAQIELTGSPSLQTVRDRVQNLATELASSGRSDVELAADLLDRMPPALLSAVPAPGTCPIVTFGEARLAVRLADVRAGTGTRKDPVLLASRYRLVFEGDVEVLHRTKDDELIFTAEGPTEARIDAIQFIPVHEGFYALRPIDFGLYSAGSVSVPFRFTLSFRNRGCLQPVSTCELWVRIFDPDVEEPLHHSKVEEEARQAQEELEQFTQLLQDYENKSGLDHRRRAIAAEIDRRRALLERLRRLQ